jgi:chromosome segregation ATPase
MRIDGDRLYNLGLDILITKEEVIEKLQDKLKEGSFLYNGTVKVEDAIRDAFVDLLQTKYPELAAISDAEVEAMIIQVPQIQEQIEELTSQLTVSLGSFSSIAELEDALRAAIQERDEAQTAVDHVTNDVNRYASQIQEAREYLEIAIPREREALERWSELRITLGRDHPDTLEAEAVYRSAHVDVISAEGLIVVYSDLLEGATSDLLAAEQILVEKQAVVTPLQAQFDEADAIQQQINGFSSNVVYSLYDTFSDKEKELVALVTS